MNLPGFTAGFTLAESNAYRMVAAFQEMSGAVRAAQSDGDIEPLAGTCAATTECGECIRLCIPRFGCRSFRLCCCTTHNGKRKCTSQPC
jgi:hypothetical protein